MSKMITEASDMRDLLKKVRTIAVVGLSNDPDRPSYEVADYLRGHGYEIIPVNPMIDEWQGLKAYPSVQAIGRPVDMVDVFRRPEFVMDVVEDAIAAGAGAVWMQLGVLNEEAAERAVAAGIPVVADRCAAVEHRRMAAAEKRRQ